MRRILAAGVWEFNRDQLGPLVWFLYIARGSAGEVRNALLLAQRLVKRGILRGPGFQT